MMQGLPVILATTLGMAFSATLISTVIGVPLGLWLEQASFPGKGAVVRFMRTMMGVPPVVIGLIVFLLLARNGPLGFLQMLFTVRAMVFAQVLIITPIICGIVYASAEREAGRIRAFGTAMGADGWQHLRLLVREMAHEIYFAAVTGFGRSISEVGAVMIVGGNILNKTRTMTTAITLLRNKGNYNEAVTLGALLLITSFIVQVFTDRLRRGDRIDENH